jgi:uncharacterized membrane protein
MTVKTFLLAYAFALIPMLAIDGVWLAVMSRKFYAPRLGEMMADSPRLVPAAIFYAVYLLGVSLLVIVPAVNDKAGYLEVVLRGGLLGLVAYGTYDLTNQATLKRWPVVLTVVDLIWGTLITAVVSVISVAVTGAIV